MPTLALQTTAIKAQLNNHPTADTTLIERIYNEEYKALAKPFFMDVSQFEESVSSVIATATLTITAAYFVIESIFDSTNLIDLEMRDEAWWNELDDPTTAGVPEYFVHRLDGVYLYPVPNAINAYKVRGRKTPATLTTTQVPFYPEEWHYVIEQKTVYRIALMLGLGQILMDAQNAALNRISELTENRTQRRRLMTGQLNVTRGGQTY